MQCLLLIFHPQQINFIVDLAIYVCTYNVIMLYIFGNSTLSFKFQTALSNPDLDSRDCVRLISAIGSVLSSMSAKDLLSPLESLVQSRVESLQALAMTDVSPLTKGQVEKELVILSSLCHHIYPTLQSGEEHPVSV